MSFSDDRPVDFWPEALDPDEGAVWTVKESAAIDSCVALLDKVANVPRARTRAMEQIRFHELAHVAYTDEHDHDGGRLYDQLCRMLEEVRVDAILLYDQQIDVRNRHDDFDWSQTDVPTKQPESAVWFLQTAVHTTKSDCSPDVTAFNKACFDRMHPKLQRLTQGAVKGILARRDRETREFWARKLYEYFTPPVAPKTAPPIKGEVIAEIRAQEREEKEEEQEKAEYDLNKGRKPQLAPPRAAPELDPNDESDLKSHSFGSARSYGKAEIHDHLVRQGKWNFVKAPFTRTGRGIVPEFMENYCIDKRIYRTEHRGGIMVIDTSGSMHPNWPLIERQMQDFPNLVVISYRSVTRDGERHGFTGRICVHARSGRIDPHFRAEPGTIGGNAVDVEALEYGAKFKGPRIWVSDGRATGGVYDTDGYGYINFNSALQIRVRHVMNHHRYIRVLNLESALRWVAQSGQVEYATVGMLETEDSALPPGIRSYNHMDPASKYYRKGRRA